MHWKQISEKPLLAYELYDDENLVLTLSINYKTSIFRAECKWGKRVFFINKSGLWKDKTVLKNEEQKIPFNRETVNRYRFINDYHTAIDKTLYNLTRFCSWFYSWRRAGFRNYCVR